MTLIETLKLLKWRGSTDVSRREHRDDGDQAKNVLE